MYRDRVYETSTSTGTGSFVLAGAVNGYRTFSAAFSTSAAYYVIVNRDNPSEWEIGSFTVSGTTLARVSGNVLAGSSGASTLVNFSAGVKDVYNAPPAARMVDWDSIDANGVTAASGSIGPAAGQYISSVSIAKSGSSVVLSGATAALPAAGGDLSAASGSVGPTAGRYVASVSVSKSGNSVVLAGTTGVLPTGDISAASGSVGPVAGRYVASVSLAKSGNSVVLSGTTVANCTYCTYCSNCNCNCVSNCNCRC